MSISGEGSRLPPASTTRTIPSFSATNMRPSGAQAAAVGRVRPAARVFAKKPGGSVPVGVAAASLDGALSAPVEETAVTR